MLLDPDYRELMHGSEFDKYPSAINFLMRGSFSIMGMNGGISLVEVVNPAPGCGRGYYDKFFEFSRDGQPSITEVSVLFNVAVLALLNFAVVQPLSTEDIAETISIGWIVEYGVHCHYHYYSNLEVGSLSSDIISKSLASDNTAYNPFDATINWNAQADNIAAALQGQSSKMDLPELIKYTKANSANKLEHALAVEAVRTRNGWSHNSRGWERPRSFSGSSDGRSNMPRPHGESKRSSPSHSSGERIGRVEIFELKNEDFPQAGARRPRQDNYQPPRSNVLLSNFIPDTSRGAISKDSRGKRND